MPVTKTAKRALRVSKRKGESNSLVATNMEIAIRKAKKSKSLKSISEAFSSIDRAAKKRVINKNKAARTKSQLAKLAPKTKKPSVKK